MGEDYGRYRLKSETEILFPSSFLGPSLTMGGRRSESTTTTEGTTTGTTGTEGTIGGTEGEITPKKIEKKMKRKKENDGGSPDCGCLQSDIHYISL